MISLIYIYKKIYYLEIWIINIGLQIFKLYVRNYRTNKIGIVYVKNKDYLNAEKFFLNLVRRYPTNIQLYSYLIPVMIEQKNFKNALKFAERLNSLNKNMNWDYIWV